MNFYKLGPEEQQRASAARLFDFVRRYVYPYHPYLRRMYREAGLDLSRLRTPDDVRRLPIIDKQNLQTDPLLFFLRPNAGSGPPLPKGYDTEKPRPAMIAKYLAQALLNRPRDYSRLVRPAPFRERVRRRGLLEWLPIHHHVSTGSTGNPTPVTFTHYDFTHALTEMSGLLIHPGRTDPARAYFDWTDRVMNVFPGAPHIAFFGPVLAKVLNGVSTFETFGGALIPTDRQISIFSMGGFSTITAIPSYLVHWLRRAAVLLEQGKIKPLSSFKVALVGAEPLSEPLRAAIRKLALDVGADPRFTIYQTFGLTELKWTGVECSEGSGIHMNPRYFYYEILHPTTREPVAPGEPGVLVFSHIGWRGTVLIRYWTGDLIKGGATWDRCPRCGYTYLRLHTPICRAEKDFTKLKGSRVDLSLLVEVVRDTPGVRQFQVLLQSADGEQEFARDELVLHIVAEHQSPAEEVQRTLSERVKAYTEVSPDRIILETDEAALEKRLFARNGIKAEYVVERRTHHI